MNISKQLYYIALVALVSSAHADTINSWFPGALDPKIMPAIPTNFVIVSMNPQDKGTKEMDVLSGVIWAPERTARQFEFSGDKNLNNAKEPLFAVALTSAVRQKAGTDRFTNEKDLEATTKASGVKKVKVSKTKWGAHPVLSMTFENPRDGTQMFLAWLGLNDPDEWTILINYRVPQGKGHPTKEELKIWEKFLSETKAP